MHLSSLCDSLDCCRLEQVLQEAAAIDAKAAAGQSILPLCGLPLAVKDSIDCLPYPTSAATPALLGERGVAACCTMVVPAQPLSVCMRL